MNEEQARQRLLDTGLIGQHFGRWIVLDILPTSKKDGGRKVQVRCICGTERTVLLNNLRNRDSMSCGCWHKEQTSKCHYKHGESNRTAEYRSWAAMLSRCHNPQHVSYRNYGKRGIKVCHRWYTYENFLADMGRRPPKTSLERHNNNRNYTPSNCCWATAKQQAHNTRRNVYLTYKGERFLLSEWAKRLGITHAALRKRIDGGWSLDRLFSSHKHNVHLLTYNGITLAHETWATRLGISRGTLRRRIDAGWSLEEIFSPQKHRGNSRFANTH